MKKFLAQQKISLLAILATSTYGAEVNGLFLFSVFRNCKICACV